MACCLAAPSHTWTNIDLSSGIFCGILLHVRAITREVLMNLIRNMCSEIIHLTHWGRVTHICVSNLIIIVSNNGLAPGRRRAIIWTNAGILLIWPLGTNYSKMFDKRKCIWKCRLQNGVHWSRPQCFGITITPLKGQWVNSYIFQELYITHNMQPLTLPTGVFDGLRLQKLTLAGNGLTETGFLKGLVATEIQLDDNNLNEFTTYGCIGLRETRRLSMVRCGLRRLTRDNFSSLSGLQELDLEGNDLTLLDAKVFEVLPQLRVLDLADNDLEEFMGNFSNVLPEVDSIALEGNDLRTLPESMQPLFSRLRNLTLQGNPFHCNCELHWLARWLEQDAHRSTLEDVEAVTCATPEARNFTTVSDYGFQCRAPAVFNATFDNDGITLLCTAEGDPPPTVTWVSPGGAEKSTVPPPWQREVFKTRSSLTISRDSNYTCIASNIVGEDSITVNTRKMPSSGLKFHVESREIEILETQTGFTITALLIALLGYIVRLDSLSMLNDNKPSKKKNNGNSNGKSNGKTNGDAKKKSGKWVVVVLYYCY